MKEFGLRIPVCCWLMSRGLSPVLECSSLRHCDIVGIRFEGKPLRLTEMVAMELKLSNVSEVIRQCLCHVERVNETWAAMPMAVALRSVDRFAETLIGLLGIDGAGKCHILNPALGAKDCDLLPWKNLIRRRTEYVWRMKHPQMLRFPAMRLVLAENNRAAKERAGSEDGV